MQSLFFGLLLIFSFLFSSGQNGYKKGDIIINFPAQKILNNNANTGSFNSLKKQVTIIDFFGTWCMPCIKALPNLDSLQKKHASQVAVLLVSVEKEDQLNKFIKAKKNFAFAIIMDGNNGVTNLFQPPSFPYTVVVNSNNKIIAITAAAAITDEKIKVWLTEKDTETVTQQSSKTVTKAAPMAIENKNMNSLNELSQQFIYAAKTGDETMELLHKLKNIDFDSLSKNLSTDDEKKAFWINMYNGYTQLFLKKDPDKYKKRNKFFKAKQIEIAGKQFSLDEIEHDILRRSKIKWSLGYLNKIFPGKTAKALRVDKLDYRIHFALNCGAKSCPPIAFYEPSMLQAQLDVATRAYLTSEAVYNTEKNTLALPTIMSWFRHDFKGKKNMMKLVKKYGIVPQDKYPHISFKKYDWNLYLNNYKN